VEPRYTPKWVVKRLDMAIVDWLESNRLATLETVTAAFPQFKPAKVKRKLDNNSKKKDSRFKLDGDKFSIRSK
jgi:hypothetical protein